MTAVFPPLVRSVLETLSDALLVFDANGRLAYANSQGRSLLNKIAPEDGDPNLERARLLLEPRGARADPLVVDGVKVGEAVRLATNSSGRHGTLAERERGAILETLRATGWKLTETARRLGISRTTLWRRLHAYGLERPETK